MVSEHFVQADINVDTVSIIVETWSPTDVDTQRDTISINVDENTLH